LGRQIEVANPIKYQNLKRLKKKKKTKTKTGWPEV
jgi:hypothetical protein